MEFSTWTDEQLAGQRLMAGFDGTDMDAALEHLIAGLRVGGLILFKRNIASPEQIAGLCRAAQACARGSSLPPLFIAIDQEGGQVARLGPPFTQFAGNPAMRDEADAARFAEITATELAAVGINMNLAPVVDVAPEGIDSIMAGRAFGYDPHAVARRIMAVAKHFPGIGRTTLDSHRDRPVLDVDLTALEAFDLVPFRAAVDRAVAGIMLAHILYTGLDPKWPASLSPRIARDLLRKRMGFKGIVMTDDLEMGAIERHYGFDVTMRQVLKADIDVVLICHSREKLDRAFGVMVGKIGKSETIRRAAEASAARIMALKTHYLG
jgi:beta-N-acetylhexosaminidase